MNLDKEISRGFEAERILNEPMVKEALSLIEEDILHGMKRSAIGDVDTHHELVLMYQIHQRFIGHFKTAMETGKLATIQKETAAQKVKRFLKVS